MKKILGLDIGTNSIGWALIEKNEEENKGRIIDLGCRIIPMGEDKSNFEQGAQITRNAKRRMYRMSRRRNKRFKQRRNKLIYVLHKLDMLPDFIHIEDGIPPPEKIQTLKIKPIPKGTKQLNALEIIELRKKSLYDKIDIKDFGRILYLYNQLRGYAGGNPEEENITENEETEISIKNDELLIEKVIIKAIKEIDKIKPRKKSQDKEISKYEITVENIYGKEYTGTTIIQNLKEGNEIELEIKIKRDKKTGDIKTINFVEHKKSNWKIELEQLENEFKSKGNPHIAELFYEKLKENPWYRIRNHVILRDRYKREFDAIWDNQSKYYDFLNNTDKSILQEIAEYLFPGKSKSQSEYREIILKEGLKYLIKEMIIYYQRPLKPQIAIIGNCRFEKNLKVIPQSHPLYQEYRIWQEINNLSINTITTVNGKKYYYDRPLSTEEKELLYNKLNNQKEINHSSVFKLLNLRKEKDYLNGMHVKSKLKGNETLLSLKKLLGDDLFIKLKLEDTANLTLLWRILYNWLKDDDLIIDTKNYEKNPEKYNMYNPNNDNEYDLNSDRIKKIKEYLESILDNENKNIINDEILIKIGKIRFTRRYGSLSAKAISNILNLMRAGKYFDINKIRPDVKEKIEKIKNAEEDENIDNFLREYYSKNQNCFDTGGLMASYSMILYYGQHTAEISDGLKDYHDIKTYEQRKIEDPENAEKYTLRNPIVEQILNETLQLVKSIWKHHKTKPDEIRIELVRELKNNAEERKKIYKSVLDNEKRNNEIRKKLEEQNIPQTLINIEKYKLWEEQNKISPYTLKTIEFSKLFSDYYQVDHIIPRSRFFDDSLANKVICESVINSLKSNRTAWEFINSSDSKLPVEDYINHVTKNFYGRKRKNLLLAKIPDNFIERQKKDTQYITVKVKEELGKIVGTNNVKTTTGVITNYLSQQWGLKVKLKELTKYRYQLMEKLTGEKLVEYITDEYGNRYLNIKNWSKRIDNRSHAIDALIVACTEQSHIQRLNNLNKEFQKYLRENSNLNTTEDIMQALYNLDEKEREETIRQMPSFRNFPLPWKNFPEEAEEKIKSIVISHKPKQKLLIQVHPKTGKEYLRIRGALHEETLYGKEKTYRIPISKLKDKNDIQKFIDESIVSETIRETLLNHLEKFDNNAKKAFSNEGIQELNEKRKNKIRAVRVFYTTKEKSDDSLIPLFKGSGYDIKTYIKPGDNYCFAIADNNGRRKYGIISLIKAVELITKFYKQGEKNINNIIKHYFENLCEKTKGCRLLFTLSHNDLVYLPELNSDIPPLNKKDKDYNIYWGKINKNRIFRVIKFSGDLCFFTTHTISGQLKYKNQSNETFKEFGSYDGCCPYIYTMDNKLFHQNNKLKSNEENRIFIQEFCIKIRIDRLGNIEPDIL